MLRAIAEKHGKAGRPQPCPLALGKTNARERCKFQKGAVGAAAGRAVRSLQVARCNRQSRVMSGCRAGSVREKQTANTSVLLADCGFKFRVANQGPNMPVARLLKGPVSASQNCQAIVCVGLALEARIIIGEFSADIGSVELANLTEALDWASAASCGGIVSFGLAGSLAADLRSGDIVVASGVIGRNGSFATDDAWSGSLLSAIPRSLYAPIAGVDVAVAVTPERRELASRSGALVVDMESHIIAQFAANRGLRFVAVRVVIDAMHRRIPKAALDCISHDGETRMPALGRSLLERPSDTLDVLRLCSDWQPARRALLDCSGILSASVGQIAR